MKISDLSERSRLLRRLDEQPDDVDTRRSLARLYLDAGEPSLAAQELKAIVTVHIARNEAEDALRVARVALGLEPSSIELRMLLAQAHARFPAGDTARIAVPIDEAKRAAAPVQSETVQPSSPQARDGLPPQTPTMKVMPVADRVPRRRRAPKPAPTATSKPALKSTPSRPPGIPAAAAPARPPMRKPETAVTRAVSPAPPSQRERKASNSDASFPSEDTAVRDTQTIAREAEQDGVEQVTNVDPPPVTKDGGMVSPPTIPARPVDAFTRSAPRSNTPGPVGATNRTDDKVRAAGGRTTTGVGAPVAAAHAAVVNAVAGATIMPEPPAVTLEQLPSNPLFERLPHGARQRFFDACEVVRFAPGAELVGQGDTVDEMILVYEGTVLAGDDDVLEAGRLVGEFEFLTGSRSRGRAIAGGVVTALRVSRERCVEFRAEDVQINDAFVATLRDRLLHDLMSRAPLFASLSAEQKRDLSGRFFALNVSPGETVMQAGEISRRLFVLQSGELVLDGRGTAGAQRIPLVPGEFFGYVATVLGRPVQVGVVASNAATLLVLPEQEVYRLVAGNKGVARAARREGVERGDLAVSIENISGLGGLVVRREL